MAETTRDRHRQRNAKGQFIARDPRAASTSATMRAWTRRLTEGQRSPVFLVGIGHGRRNLGALYVMTPDEPQPLERAQVRALLQRVLAELEVSHA
jgi:hypothetical protein